jgi:hypothetical protein
MSNSNKYCEYCYKQIKRKQKVYFDKIFCNETCLNDFKFAQYTQRLVDTVKSQYGRD